MYDFCCEHCGGLVRTRRVDQEALRHKGSFVIVEDVPIGVCESCGARYFDASVVRRGYDASPRRQVLTLITERFIAQCLSLTVSFAWPRSNDYAYVPSQRFDSDLGDLGTRRSLSLWAIVLNLLVRLR